jgi:hypothetical protein
MPSWARLNIGNREVEPAQRGPLPNNAAPFDLPPPPPPNTPFFRASTGNYNYENNSKEEEDGKDEEEEGVLRMESSTTIGSMFGTYKEQRLQKLAKRVGMQMEAEMDEL